MAAHGLTSAVKLASNESPFGPLPGVLDAVAAATGDSGRYPDHLAETLRATLAARHGVEADQVAVGCGSVGMLQQLLLSYAGPGHEVLFPWPSFIAYPQFSLLAGATVVEAPLTAWATDVDALLACGHPRHRDGAARQPEQPDQHRAAHRRADPPGGGAARDRAARRRRGLSRVRDRPRRARRPRPLRRPGQRRRAPDLLEGVGAGRAARRLPRRRSVGRRTRSTPRSRPSRSARPPRPPPSPRSSSTRRWPGGPRWSWPSGSGSAASWPAGGCPFPTARGTSCGCRPARRAARWRRPWSVGASSPGPSRAASG